jgi:predicted membrane-bound spermidine synthase
VALGLAFTSWHLSPAELLAGVIGLISAAILYFNVRDNELGTPTLVVGGVAYVAFLTGLTILGVL